jgi:hypothetical protein
MGLIPLQISLNLLFEVDINVCVFSYAAPLLELGSVMEHWMCTSFYSSTISLIVYMT